MERKRGPCGFTIIELLTVIGIIMLLVGLMLPNFAAMMKGRRWTAAISNIQVMVWRARALATNLRTDIAVEFDVRPDATTLWLESESNEIERLPNMASLVNEVSKTTPQGGAMWYFLTTVWVASGGGYADPNVFVPGDTKPLYVGWNGEHFYGDNARQSEEVKLGGGMSLDLDPERSPNFVSWDAPDPTGTHPYGKDGYRDIRIGPNGALVQTRDPVICVREVHIDERKSVQAVRCTGRLVPVR